MTLSLLKEIGVTTSFEKNIISVQPTTCLLYTSRCVYETDDKVMMNRSWMSKWSFNLGEVTLTFFKR